MIFLSHCKRGKRKLSENENDRFTNPNFKKKNNELSPNRTFFQLKIVVLLHSEKDLKKMKTYKILLFIFLAIAALGLLCFFFPKDGITLGRTTLRFPSLEQILARKDSERADSLRIAEMAAINERDSLLNTLQDSLSFYQSALITAEGRFHCPNGDLNYFADLYKTLQKAKAGNRIVRILHYGDSQIEMDRISGNIREFFQERFGGGGPGMMPALQTIPSVSVYQSATGNFSCYAIYGDIARNGEESYGIMAKAYRLNGNGTFTASASNNPGAKSKVKQFSSIRLIFFNRGDRFSASLSGKGQTIVEEQATNKKGVQSFVWNLDTPVTRFSISLSGEGDIYGICGDNGYGVAVDNIPLRGCSGTIFTQINDTLMQQSLQEADAGLIILQFGGNAMPGVTSQTAVNSYKKRIINQIQYFKRVCPQAKILFIGPSDMAKRVNGQMDSYPYLEEMNEALKQAVTENGAAYWDMFTVMGGRQSMIAWHNNGLAGADYIHFTPKGADKMGEILCSSFETLFNYYDTQNKIAETK